MHLVISIDQVGSLPIRMFQLGEGHIFLFGELLDYLLTNGDELVYFGVEEGLISQ